MIDNLNFIKEQGMDKFLAKEAGNWKCPKCGDVICCHTQACYNCLPKPSKHNRENIPPKKVTEADLIAPCGMNCGVCMAYLREQNKCPGCRGDDAKKMPSCLRCSIKNCETVAKSKSNFCFECEKHCTRLKHLDKRYRTKYHMSMIENLEFIRDNGIGEFLRWQAEKYKCPECGGVICTHNGRCYKCQHVIERWKG